MQDKLCSFIIKYALKNQNQIFLATQSHGFIDNMLAAAQKIARGLDTIAIYRLYESGTDVGYHYLGGEEAYHAREDPDKDLRSHKESCKISDVKKPLHSGNGFYEIRS